MTLTVNTSRTVCKGLMHVRQVVQHCRLAPFKSNDACQRDLTVFKGFDYSQKRAV